MENSFKEQNIFDSLFSEYGIDYVETGVYDLCSEILICMELS